MSTVWVVTDEWVGRDAEQSRSKEPRLRCQGVYSDPDKAMAFVLHEFPDAAPIARYSGKDDDSARKGIMFRYGEIGNPLFVSILECDLDDPSMWAEQFQGFYDKDA